MRFSIDCPHCDTRAIARSSHKLSDTMREITFACPNVECGHTFVANLEAVRTLSPSGMPKNGLNLPLSQHVAERVMRQMQLQLSLA
ncbi:transcriptional regulator [Massilia dura]|jgi:predicted RNA-binding Zn-ribbon protein involved in translation (DUF1610 family)|uniref:Transcriptional regulator n=1 Tax=Pseudoduganella dura TaxID=321982 RepID=A0A6I3XDR4_9BURK|nr:ogr/Delta-like zinc finger family protein [Pseudoduganella dura]MUI10928.1 transcriptional regulator [Pseudoduganella dura]GGY12760.1 hypothetical protein GCM10007386_48840 [Pseudoduganella dura]